MAKSLENDGHDPQVIAGFLQRCLFTMFAEDIRLLPQNGFMDLLKRVKPTPQGFPVLISALWKEMATGTHYSALLFQEIAHFNGGLFENTTGKADTGDRPLLPKTQSIRQQDAVLAYDERIPRKDPETGEILTIWDGHTTKPHPVTGNEVPDESARAVLFDYLNPRRAEWPQADYIVGNPPFIGASRMRDALGDGYTEALRKAWKGDVPESADLVMFWWCKAAAETAQGRCNRFGFITTNSIHQTFNRRVIEPFLAAEGDPRGGRAPADPANGTRMAKPKKSPKGNPSDTPSTTHSQGPTGARPLHLAYAIPDHPWIDSADGAAVRIAMTVAAPGKSDGVLETVTAERPMEHGECDVTLVTAVGVIAPNLQVGADVSSCAALLANSKLSCPGVKLHGSGFIVDEEQAAKLGLGTIPGIEDHLKGYRNGKDLTNRPRNVRVIDLFGLTDEQARDNYPNLYQHVMLHVKPDRDGKAHTKDGATYAKLWWIFGKPRQELRKGLSDLPRYIATVETSKHRFFTFLDQSILPDNMLIAIASDDAFHLGVLSSSVHVTWALAAGGRLGMGNDPRYNKSRCFDPFPFPALEEGELKQRIRDLGERLDLHRKRQQELHPGLTLTGMYNVLEKLRTGDPLTAKEKTIHDQGLVSLLKQIHDELDEAVLEAYGWGDLSRSVGVSPTSGANACGRDAHTPCDTLLTRLVALNHTRAAEEKRGQIRWLRPEYQSSGDHRSPQQTSLPGTDTDSSTSKINNQKTTIINQTTAWPAKLPAQVTLIRHFLTADPAATPEHLSTHFGRKNAKRQEQIEGIIETLRGLGQV